MYEFGTFRLDPKQRLLLSNPDGRPVALTPRVFDTLLCLVENHGQLVDKATLMQTVWPDVVVEENSLNQNISALRRALGENPGEHRYIVTVPGRGYRFVAEVGTVSAPAPAAEARPSGPSQTAPPMAESPQPATRHSIAVLPFANLTRDPEKEYFGDGMAEELIHMLARVPGLKVPARTSSFAYKGRNTDVRQIARDLGVETVLEGSVRSAGERIRLTAQLIDGQSGYHLWSESYDRQFTDLFSLQDDLAGAIVKALKLNLDPSSEAALEHAKPTQDLEAYQLYLQAESLTYSSRYQPALALLEQAIARDPAFARAIAALAELRILFAVYDLPMPDPLGEAEREAERALALDPGLAAAHVVLGGINSMRGRWIAAEEHFRTATSLATDANNHRWHGSLVLQSVGHLARALEQARVGYRMAPVVAFGAWGLGLALVLVGEDTDALRYADIGAALGAPRVTPLSDLYAALALHAGRYAEAVEYDIESLSPALRDKGAADTIRVVYAAIEDPSKQPRAIAALQDLEARASPAELTQGVRKQLLRWYTLLGALDVAYALMTRSLDHFARSGTIGAGWGVLWLPEMKPFRQDPRFNALAERLGFIEYWQKYGPPDGYELRDGKLSSR